MRVENWNPGIFDQEIIGASMERLEAAAEVVAAKARTDCPVGTLSRPIYRRGSYKGETWTKRDAGALKKTIRVTKKEEEGIVIAKFRNVWIMAGNYNVYYARIVEYYGKSFLRNALINSIPEIKSILENG